MGKLRTCLASIVGILGVVSCGGTTEGTGVSSNAVSCTITQTISAGTTTDTFSFCIEVTGLTPDQIDAEKRSCNGMVSLVDGGAGSNQTSSYADGPCPRANAIGSCNVTSGSFSQATWYYKDTVLTAADIERICKQAGGTFTPA
jgi:hypothetical protein